MRRTRTAVFLACAASLWAAVPAHAATWLVPPTDATDPGQLGYAPQVATDGVGDDFAVWQSSDNDPANHPIPAVLAAIRPAGGTWGEPVLLSSPGAFALGPAIASDARGDAVAVWFQAPYAGTGGLYAARRPAGGSFGPAELVASGGLSPAVGVDGQGRALIVYSTSNSLVATEAAGGAPWGAPVTVANEFVSAVKLALNPAGDAVALWNGSAGGGSVVKAVLGSTVTGKWQPPAQLSGAGVGIPSVAIDPGGNVAAIWTVGFGYQNTLQVATRAAGAAAWANPVNLSTIASGEVNIALGGQGSAVAAWGASSAGTGVNEIQTATGSATTGTWNGAAAFPGLGPGNAVQVPEALATDPGGDAAMVFYGNTVGQSPGLYATSLLVGGSSWSAPTQLLSSDGAFNGVSLALDGTGGGVAVWSQPSGQGEASTAKVSAVGYEAGGPTLQGLTVPVSGMIGKPLSFSVAPLVDWPPGGTTAWRFGDGGSAMTASAMHTYARPGRYTVTVTSGDTLGNATTATNTIVIRAPVPVLSAVAQAHTRWREGGKPKGHTPVGTTFEFSLSEAARVTLAFAGKAHGAHARLTASEQIGRDEIPFSGRISAARKLPPGAYTVTITATDSFGQHSASHRLHFTIV